MRILAIFAVVFIVLMAYIRLAPNKADTWHQPSMLTGPGDYPEEGGFRVERRIAAPADDVLSRLRSIALATPRTDILAGSVESGLITFITRSRIMGFPDYTTASIYEDTLSIYGRLRFGRSDLGVNQARVQAWLAQLDGMIEAS
ncbi:DUF1499 domain-containing protein [Yoonia sp. 2307UL14-13]|uniref:DUF1499 domain-containing protein n=1 Tax=Yoonia sp. 2307UL14-13 TaxID=3126506 RepID=UPI0030B34E0D